MNAIVTQDEFRQVLSDANSVVEGSIFVYKSGFIGSAYVNKEALAQLGASVVNSCLRGMTQNAVNSGLDLQEYNKYTIGIIGPAYGAISYPPIVAEYLESLFPEIRFITARTQLTPDGTHYVPDKLRSAYAQADAWIIVEDIVNQASTLREVGGLLRLHFDTDVISAFSLVDRGRKTNEEMKVDSFYPFIHVDMEAFDPRTDASLFDSDMEIHTELGKGATWVSEFGYPPYADDIDFNTSVLFTNQ